VRGPGYRGGHADSRQRPVRRVPWACSRPNLISATGNWYRGLFVIQRRPSQLSACEVVILGPRSYAFRRGLICVSRPGQNGWAKPIASQPSISQGHVVENPEDMSLTPVPSIAHSRSRVAVFCPYGKPLCFRYWKIEQCSQLRTGISPYAKHLFIV
jgi:hypothetical protein